MISKTPQSKRTTDALVKSARALHLANLRRITLEWTFGKWMTARYGDRWTLPEVVRNAIDEGNGAVSDITLESLDAYMTAAGYPPLHQ